MIGTTVTPCHDAGTAG